MPEEFRGNAVQSHSRREHQIKTSPRVVPSGYLSALCISEVIFLSQLALLSGYVFVSSKEQGSQNVQSGPW